MSASSPSNAGANFFDLLVNSDPRVAFDVLHVGVLRAIEEMEHNPPLQPQRCTAMPATKAVIVGEGVDARFVIPTHQPALDVRLQQPQDLAGVAAYLESDAPDAMQQALGPIVLHAVQKYRPQVMHKRRTRKEPHAEDTAEAAAVVLKEHPEPQ